MGAFDEWVWVTELHRHGFHGLHGMAFTVWCSDGDGPSQDIAAGAETTRPPPLPATAIRSPSAEKRDAKGTRLRESLATATSSTEAVIGALRGEDCIAAIETAPAPPLRPLVASPPPPPPLPQLPPLPPLPPHRRLRLAPVPLRMALWFGVIVGGAASILYIRFRGRPEKDEQRELQGWCAAPVLLNSRSRGRLSRRPGTADGCKAWVI